MACEICKKVYVPPTDDSSFAFDEKPHVCQICGKTFALKIQLKRHLLSHEGNVPYVCITCEKQLDQSSSYNLRLSKKGNFVCETCNKCFVTKRLLLRHAGEHTLENILNCDKCGESFKNMTALKKHATTHKRNRSHLKINISKDSNGTSYQCQECGKVFTKVNLYEAHCLNHKKYYCSRCNVYFASNKLLREHLANGSCHVSFEQQSSLNSSSSNSTNSLDCKSKKHECSLCNKSFARKSALEGHMNTHFLENHESPVEDDSDKDMDFQCNVKDDNKSKDLCLPKLKIRRSFPCEKCSLVFSSKLILNKHVRSHGQTSENSLKIEVLPNYKKTYLCRICKETFNSKDDYKQHKFTHGTEEQNISSKDKEEKTYSCQLCMKVFSRRKHLKKHVKAHLDPGCSDESNPNKTPVENNPDKSNSQDGVDFHSGKKEKRAKNYACGHCGKLFVGETCWRKHEAKHLDDKEKDDLANKGRKGKKGKILICEFCNEDFTGKRHVFQKHKLSHTPEVCGICDKRFIDRASLREHCKIHIGTEEGRRFLECSQKVLDAKNGSAVQPEPKVEYIYLVLR